MLQVTVSKVRSYNILATVLIQLGRLDEALLYFDKAIQLNPKNDSAYKNKY